MRARLRGTAAAVTVALACALGVSSCSDRPADEITYAVDGTLTTYNTNTVATSDPVCTDRRHEPGSSASPSPSR